MTLLDGQSDNGNAGLLEQTEENEIHGSVPVIATAPDPLPGIATRAKLRPRQQIQQNRFVIVAAGAIVLALLIFVDVSMPHRSGPHKSKNYSAMNKDESTKDSDESDEKSLFPITDSGRPAANETHHGFVNDRDLQRTVIGSGANASQPISAGGGGTLSSIPPFGDKWQAPPYEPGSTTADTPDVSKAERESMEKPSLIYVRDISDGAGGPQTANEGAPDLGLGLVTGTHLRARLESATSTAVRAPVLAVIEYNYEQGGEIIVPAGARRLAIFGMRTVPGTLTCSLNPC